MCELFCLSGRLPTRANLSLHTFARRGGYGGSAIDGWGLAFHDGRDVRLYKEPEPAGDSAWLAFIEGRRLPSRIILSHIRRAVQGAVSLVNTQPFARELGGHMHIFAHNGRLADIENRHAGEWRRFQPLGQTDSEVAFCILLERLSALWGDGAAPPPLHNRLQTITQFAREIRELGPANFLYTDGDALFAHGHRRSQADGRINPPGLWRLKRGCAVDVDALAASGVTIRDTPGQDLTLIASVPLTEEAWVPFAEGEIVVTRNGAVAS